MWFDTKTHLSTIAVKNPGSIAIFRKYGLDYCCGGARPLAEACQEKKLDPAQIATEIEKTSPTEHPNRSWEKEPAEKLIEHILTAFHQKHRRDLQILIPLAKKVEAVHADHPELPVGLQQLLTIVSSAMEEHMNKEETILFPLLIHGGDIPPYAPIQIMTSEHLSHKEKLIELRATCNDFKLPLEACTSWRALYAGVEQLIADLMEHIHLENNVLFPIKMNERFQ